MSCRYGVVVVGAGPVGLCLSNLLGAAGVKNLVLEKHPGLLDLPKARGLRGQSMEIMAALGLDKAVRAKSRTIEHRRVVWSNKLGGEIQAEVEGKLRSTGQEEDALIAQADLERVLLTAAQASPETSTVLFEHELQSFKQSSSGVECVVRNRKEDAEVNFSCR